MCKSQLVCLATTTRTGSPVFKLALSDTIRRVMLFAGFIHAGKQYLVIGVAVDDVIAQQLAARL